MMCVQVIKAPRELRIWKTRPDEMLAASYDQAKKINTNNIPVYVINHEDFKLLLKDMSPKLDVYPNTGTATIQVLLSHQPSSLLVAGFSFYMAGVGKTIKSCYIDGHLPQEALRGLTNREKRGKSSMGHSRRSSRVQANYFKDCIVGNGFIDVKVDPGLAAILNVASEHIQEQRK